MSEFPHEQLGNTTSNNANLPQSSVNVPGSTSSSSSDAAQTTQDKLLNAKDNIVNTAQNTFDSIQNHPTVQSIVNGPVAQGARDQASLTQSEFNDLANSKVKPDQKTATGQQLTHYHSMFYTLLSWKNPRATGIVFSSILVFIFMTRYLNVLHYFLRFSFFVLGITAGLEVIGKLLFDDGLTSKMRPRKYWTVPRESIEASVDEIEQLLNFFVIETQRIVYAENIYATVGAFFAALLSYGLIHLVPAWGLSLIFTSIIFLAPLIYVQNREVIDTQVENVTNIVNTQAAQLKDLTAHHTNQAFNTAKAYADEYGQKAQELVGRKQSTATTSHTGSTSTTTGSSTTSASSLPKASSTTSDFPVAPRQDPLPSAPATDPAASEFSSQLAAEREPLLNH